MEMIEMGSLSAVLGEGAAVRLGGVAQERSGETHVYFEPCEESKAVTVSDACHNEEGAGRMLDVTMTLHNVCPGRRVAVGVSLHEVDAAGGEHARGFRAITVPAQQSASCCTVSVPAARFILPEDLRTEGSGGMCGARRHFVVRVANHYVDADARC